MVCSANRRHTFHPGEDELHPIAEEIYRSRCVVDPDGVQHRLHSHVDEKEGAFLSSFIENRPEIVRTLEIGCAYGLSSLHITDAIKDRDGALHIIVDPFQSTQWNAIGVNNLRRAGFDFFELHEELSEFALPTILQERKESLDLVFVDGWHTFDHTLLDLYYANRLIRAGGYIVIDDCSLPAVSKAVSYFAKYPCFEIAGGSTPKGKRLYANRAASILKPFAEFLLPMKLYDYYYARAKYPSMVAFRKVAQDTRNWDWFASF
jgi:predicted O-methyltransferase YrrM